MPDIAIGGPENIRLHYESHGREGDPVILLIMGLAVQMVLWPPELIDALVAKGFRVIRFDNRDVGLSTHLDHHRVPPVGLEVMKFFLHLPVKAPYRIDDMAADTARFIDALQLTRVHVVGASMGGMIAQELAAAHPDKVASLTSIMSTTGRRSLPQPTWKARRAVLTPPAPKGDLVAAAARMVKVLRAIGSRSLPADPARMAEMCRRHVERSHNPAGAARQLLAIAASDDRTRSVRRIKAPTLVLHGDEDPLIKPACGIETAHVIREGGGQASAVILRGMGHDFPLPLIPQVADLIADHCRAHP